jgi:hypothetical protein
MKDSFHRNLVEEQDKIILFIGGGGKSALIRRLNEDCTALQKKTALFSSFPQKFPIESYTIIASDVKNILRAAPVEYKKHQSLYFGKKYENDILIPFSVSDISRIIEGLDIKHAFLEADQSSGKSLSNLRKIPGINALHVDRCIFVIGADVLNQKYSNTWTNGGSSFWKNHTTFSPLNIGAWYSGNSTFKRLSDLQIPVTCFINKVENTYTANLALILAKELKKVGLERVLTGSVFESALQVIR